MKSVDLKVAVGAGLAVVVPLYMIFTLPEMCESPKLMPGEAVALLAAFASYLSVHLLFELLPTRRIARFVWLWTAVVGSLLCAVALYYLAGRSIGWSLELSAKVWLFLCVLTLPSAALVYYSGMILRGMKRWHEGPKESLSISRR